MLNNLTKKVDKNAYPDFIGKAGHSLFIKGDESGVEWVDSGYIPVYRINISNPVSLLLIGATHQVATDILPATATKQELYFYSDAPQVADISTDGFITAIAEGTVTILVTSVDQAKVSSFVITVTAN